MSPGGFVNVNLRKISKSDVLQDKSRRLSGEH